MHQLILIEGIPGSGKTTSARNLYETLKKEGKKVVQYSEGDLHPADLSWMAILTSDEYKKLLEYYPTMEEKIIKRSRIEEEIVLVAYTMLGLDQGSDLYQYLASKEINAVNFDIESFKAAHLSRWKQFVEDSEPDTIYVFECVLLQNHMTYLMLDYQAEEDYIKGYFDDFIEVIKPLSPVLHYLYPESVDDAIRHVAKVRRPEYQDRTNVWIDRVVDYVESTPYGQTHQLKGIEGFIDFTSKRRAIEMDILNSLDIKSHVIKHRGDSWNHVHETLFKTSL
jgi:hypothetical protein